MQPNTSIVVLVFLGLLACALGQIVFTGNVEYDFEVGVSQAVRKTTLRIPNSNGISRSDFMVEQGFTSGWDLKATVLQYDYLTDLLYVGLDCFTICGDADGDGDPGEASDPQTLDSPDMCNGEYAALLLWPNPPLTYNPPGNSWNGFRPTVVFGIDSFRCLDEFGAYSVNTACSNPSNQAACDTEVSIRLLNIANNFGIQLNLLTPYLNIPNPTLFASPNENQPDFEFTVYNFSRYAIANPFSPGISPLRIGMGVIMGSSTDVVGEERQPPFVYSIPCAIQDDCGVCGGTNQDKDACGVCNGNNSTCKDCFGVPNGGAEYDLCGVCGGDDKSCVDCFNIPNGNAVYDRCGVCGGNGGSCGCFFDNVFTFEADDTYIELQDRQANFGDKPDLKVSSFKQHTLVRFDDIRYTIGQYLSPRPIIRAAKVRAFIRGIVLSTNGWALDKDIAIHTLKHNFCEETATWECRDVDENGCCVQWRMLPLPPKVRPDYAWEATNVTQVQNRMQGWLTFDVTEEFQQWWANSNLNAHSYLIKKVCEKEPGFINFWACEGGRCPQLIVDVSYVCDTEPPKPDPCEEANNE